MNSENLPPKGLEAFVSTGASSVVLREDGTVLEGLDELVVYFNKLSDLVAESFGFEQAEETLILGREISVLYFSQEEAYSAAIIKSKANVRLISDYLRVEIA